MYIRVTKYDGYAMAHLKDGEKLPDGIITKPHRHNKFYTSGPINKAYTVDELAEEFDLLVREDDTAYHLISKPIPSGKFFDEDQHKAFASVAPPLHTPSTFFVGIDQNNRILSGDVDSLPFCICNKDNPCIFTLCPTKTTDQFLEQMTLVYGEPVFVGNYNIMGTYSWIKLFEYNVNITCTK